MWSSVNLLMGVERLAKHLNTTVCNSRDNGLWRRLGRCCSQWSARVDLLLFWGKWPPGECMHERVGADMFIWQIHESIMLESPKLYDAYNLLHIKVRWSLFRVISFCFWDLASLKSWLLCSWSREMYGQQFIGPIFRFSLQGVNYFVFW